VGGNVRSTSTRETLLAAWAFLIGSAFLFGLAHIPGWGLWKFFPAFVAGLGFGYLFLRFGVTAAILAHFVNDYVGSLTYIGVGDLGLEFFIALLDLGLVAAGSGFFVWYVLRTWRGVGDLWRRFGRARPGRVPRAEAPAPIPPGPFGPAPGPVPPDPSPGPAGSGDPRVLPSEYVPAYRPPPYGYPPVRFQCPWCGWIEARYDAGRFTCVRCGRTA
jgi:hypothetical protein